MRFIVLFLCIHTILFAENSDEHRIIICGVCRNVSHAVENSIRNIEELGRHFKDYHVVIYENNSTDDTAQKFNSWAQANSHVTFISQTLSKKELRASRTVRIANARNKVLDVVRKQKFDNFRYLVMVDLDFTSDWPIGEIVHSVNQGFDWDSISANGITKSGMYYDRFAFRNKDFPFGPELLDHEFWAELGPNDSGSWFKLDQVGWPAVYSAFGGLAIYKTETIRKCSYSGTPTKELKKYYKMIVQDLAEDHPHIQKYLKLNPKKHLSDKLRLRKNCLVWQSSKDSSIAVCEHVTLHAVMALKGYKTFYINPKLIMRY